MQKITALLHAQELYLPMQLVLDFKGLKLTTKGQSFHIVSEKGSRTIAPGKLTSIAITANITLSTTAVILSIKHQIPILFFDRIGKAKARLWSPYFQSIATLRRMQVKFCESPEASAWLVDLFWLKTQGQLNNLDYLAKRRPRYIKALQGAKNSIKKNNRSFEQLKEQLPESCRSQMMGIEGTIARMYWQAMGNVLPGLYAFQKRSRRPAEDIFNAALNYCYGMLYSVVEGAIFAAGLDPHLGILHSDEYAKPTLAFDLIEPFRPWIDRLLLEQCFEKKLDKNFFTKNQYGLVLNKHGKAFIIPMFNTFMRSDLKYQNRDSTARNHIYHLAGRLAYRIRLVMEE